MKNLILNVKKDRIVCKTNKKYLIYEEVKDFLKTINLEDYKITIIDGEITLANKELKLTINNYFYSEDALLNNLIEKTKKEYLKRKKQFLRNKKVKRLKIITGIIVITYLAGMATGLINYNGTIQESNPYQVQEIAVNLDDKKVIEIEYEDRTDHEKYRITKAYYEGMITNISNEYGIDPQIMIAIATQESGIHDTRDDRAAIGLMQIEKAVWDNEKLSAYNYSKKTYETLTINKERLKDLEFNIRVACMHFQHCLKASKYNIPVAIQMYNFGYGNMEKVFKLCYGQNATIENTSSKCENEWLDYRSYLETGDKNYLEHILSYIENKDIKCLTETGTTTYSISPKVKSL